MVAAQKESLKQSSAPRRTGDSRAAILQAAKQLFAESGFRGASLASVAERAGLSQPGLLHHFPSKSALLLALLSEQDADENEVWKAEEHVGPLDGLRQLAGYNEAHPSDSRFMSVLLGESLSAAHPAHDYFVQRYRDMRSNIARQLDSSSLQEDQAQAVAAIIVATMDGLQYQWLLDNDVDRVQIFDLFAEILQTYIDATA